MIERKEVKREYGKSLESIEDVMCAFGWKYVDRTEKSFLFERDTQMPKYEEILNLEREYYQTKDKRVNKPSVGLLVAGSIVITVSLIYYLVALLPLDEWIVMSTIFIAIFMTIGVMLLIPGIVIFVSTFKGNNDFSSHGLAPTHKCFLIWILCLAANWPFVLH